MKAHHIDREFKHLHTVKVRLSGGAFKEHRYHRLSRRRIYSTPGTPAFAAEYQRVASGLPDIVCATSRSGRPRPTRVYFVQATGSGLIKIGKATRPGSRLKELQTSCPDALKLLATIEDKSGGALETFLHAQFAADHVRGEWFKPSAALMHYIATAARVAA